MPLAKSMSGILHDVQDDKDFWVNCYIIYKTKRGVILMENSSLLKTAATYSPTNAVPSARSGLTSLFGMGRGGTPTL